MQDRKQKETELFGTLFLIERKLEQLGNKALGERGLTIKQWMVLAAMGNLTGKPSVSEIAAYLNMTHQNIKQLCLQLERKGYVHLEKDPDDKRVLRATTTEKNKEEWNNNKSKDIAFISSLFATLTDKEISSMEYAIGKLCRHLEEMATDEEK